MAADWHCKIYISTRQQRKETCTIQVGLWNWEIFFYQPKELESGLEFWGYTFEYYSSSVDAF